MGRLLEAGDADEFAAAGGGVGGFGAGDAGPAVMAVRAGRAAAGNGGSEVAQQGRVHVRGE